MADPLLSRRPASVLVVGESLVDVVRRDAGTSSHPGGSPLNVAYGLARLGVATAFATQFGDDAHGDLLAAHLRNAGIDVLRQHPEHATSVAEATIDADGRATYSFELDWSIEAFPVPPVEILHVGSIGALRAPGARTVEALVGSAAPDVLLSYDPNIRENAIGDALRARMRVIGTIQRCHVVKLSDEDAAWLFPGMDERGVVDLLLGQGARLVALTLGAAGSIVASPSAVVELPARSSRVADTIGAGDAYTAGLLYAIASRHAAAAIRVGGVSEPTLRTIGEIASAAARVTVERPGANPPSPTELAEALNRSA